MSRLSAFHFRVMGTALALAAGANAHAISMGTGSGPGGTASGGSVGASAAGQLEIFAPCELNAQTNTGMRKCSQVIDAKGGITDLVQQRLQKQADCLYTQVGNKEGIDLDITQNPTSGSCVGDEFKHSCSIVPTQFTGNISERNADHFTGRSCGIPAYIKSTMDDNAKKIWLDFHFEARPDGIPRGDWERSHLRGAFLQALDVSWTDAKAQLKIRRSVVVRNLGGNPSPCQTFATVMQNNVNQYNAGVAGVMKQVQGSWGAGAVSTGNETSDAQSDLAHQKNMNDIFNCNNNFSNTAGVADLGSLRQSAQQLCAERSAMESAYAQLVACETIAEAQYNWITKVGSASQQANLLNQIQHDMDPLCRPGCKSPSGSDVDTCSQALDPGCAAKCSALAAIDEDKAAQCVAGCAGNMGNANNGTCGDPISFIGGNAAKLQGCINRCYRATLPTWFQNHMSGMFPHLPMPAPPRQ